MYYGTSEFRWWWLQMLYISRVFSGGWVSIFTRSLVYKTIRKLWPNLCSPRWFLDSSLLSSLHYLHFDFWFAFCNPWNHDVAPPWQMNKFKTTNSTGYKYLCWYSHRSCCYFCHRPCNPLSCVYKSVGNFENRLTVYSVWGHCCLVCIWKFRRERSNIFK